MKSQAPSLPELGVGLIYSSGLEPLFSADSVDIDVLEIEPQTTWLEKPGNPPVIQARLDVDEHIAALPGRKLVHSIGTPVGGSVDALERQLPLLQDAVRKLGAPYASEHLAFNLTPDFFTGFFLPPRQTSAGIRIYNHAVERLQAALGVPLAVETGVNYLRPRSDEMPDGEFVAELTASSGCGILLDLHNIYCNQLNGRQSIETFLSQIPLEEVWEIHLAGGFELDGFWLDAHSGAIPDALFQICREVIPQLPHLKAIIFELFPSFLPTFGVEGIKRELEKLRYLWELRGSAHSRRAPVNGKFAPAERGPTVQEWEDGLGRMVINRPPATALEYSLAPDPGIRLMQNLVHEFRASMVVSVYRLTCRLLMLTLTPSVFRKYLEEYWSRNAPQQYAGSEADGFFNYLTPAQLKIAGFEIPWFDKVLEFERASILTLCDGESRIVRFSADPLPVLRALAEARLPDVTPQEGDYEIELKAEGPISVSGVDLSRVAQTFVLH